MKVSIENGSVDISDSLLYRIVRAIDQAVSEDVPNHVRGEQWDTCNHLTFIRSDYINRNLRRFLSGEDCEIHCFNRNGWKGRIIICPASRLTISIMTESTLSQIPRKRRQRPHYQETMHYCMNNDLHGHGEQMCFFDSIPFDKEQYEADFADIMGYSAELIDGYRHCVLVYRANMYGLHDINLMVLDKKFNPVVKSSLGDYISPDFAHLTEPASAVTASRDEHNAATHRLTTLKPGIKPTLRDEEAKA